jgi:hypothetical protein
LCEKPNRSVIPQDIPYLKTVTGLGNDIIEGGAIACSPTPRIHIGCKGCGKSWFERSGKLYNNVDCVEINEYRTSNWSKISIANGRKVEKEATPVLPQI